MPMKTNTLVKTETQAPIQQLKLGVDWHADHYPFQISDPAPLMFDCKPERRRRGHGIWIFGLGAGTPAVNGLRPDKHSAGLPVRTRPSETGKRSERDPALRPARVTPNRPVPP